MKREMKKSIHATALQLLESTQITLDSIKKNIDTGDEKSVFARGNMFELVGYFDKAIESYREVLNSTPDCALTKSRLALSQIKAGKFDDALATAFEAAAKDPFCTVEALATEEKVPALTILGDALAVNQRLGDALEAYNTVAEKHELDPYTAGRLAQVKLATGDQKGALELKDKIRGSLRFSDLESVLSIGETNLTLLPTFDAAKLANAIAVDVHGRPLIVNGEIKTAEVVEGNGEWC